LLIDVIYKGAGSGDKGSQLNALMTSKYSNSTAVSSQVYMHMKGTFIVYHPAKYFCLSPPCWKILCTTPNIQHLTMQTLKNVQFNNTSSLETKYSKQCRDLAWDAQNTRIVCRL